MELLDVSFSPFLLFLCAPSTHVKTHKFVTGLQTSCYTSVHKLSTSCARTACSQFVVTSLKQAVNNLRPTLGAKVAVIMCNIVRH